MTRAERPAWLPTPRQELLLRSAVGDGDEALAAWAGWKAEARLHEVEDVDFQILPLAAKNIKRLDPSDPDAERLRGLQRFTWSRNQVLLSFSAGVLRTLAGAGIETMVLKGAALAVASYGDLSVRPMADFDVLVPRERARDAVVTLGRRYSPHPQSPDPLGRIPVHHSTSFIGVEDREFDLHWYSLWQSAPDDDFWDAAVPIEISGTPSLTLCPSDQLLQVCAHGAEWHPTPMIRWVADAVTIMRGDPGPDYARVVDQTLKRELAPVMRDALGYLMALGEPVPPEAMDRLSTFRATAAQRAARHAATRPSTGSGVLRLHWERYRRLQRLDPEAPRPPSFPAHLRQWWGFDTNRELSRHALRRLAERSRATLIGTHRQGAGPQPD